MVRSLLLALAASTVLMGAAPAPDPDPALVAKAKSLGATDVTVAPAPDGGILLGGKLGGDQFAVAIPHAWKGEALVYAHGYSTPGTPVDVAKDPIAENTGGGIITLAYRDGVAAGHSAYAKDGLGVETGARNTKRLRDFLVKLGARRVYVAGDSMGGGITIDTADRAR